SIDGNDLEQIEKAVKAAKACKGKPTAVIAACVKGKGVSYMENQCSWRGAAPNEEQYKQAMAELTANA
ncbi:MAG: transketolase, partial [Clostridia bacterium]|nr:transketolase [Clostridia bacterium]